MALLHIFLHFKKHFQFDFAVAHFHHGPCAKAEQQTFREQAHDRVRQISQEVEVPFFSNVSTSWEIFYRQWEAPLISEEACRNARYDFFNELKDSQGFAHLVLAHHRDDLLETRMMRLIRGTSLEGLQAMTFQEGWLLRPLLELSRKDLQSYVQENQFSFVEDPSNQETLALRNWMRQQWLPMLEGRAPGSLAALSRSLDHLVSSLDQLEDVGILGDQDFLDLSQFLSLSVGQKRQTLAAYMKGQGLKNYGVSHINEILKRLDKSERRHTFKMLGRRWKVDAGRMSLEPLG